MIDILSSNIFHPYIVACLEVELPCRSAINQDGLSTVTALVFLSNQRIKSSQHGPRIDIKDPLVFELSSHSIRPRWCGEPVESPLLPQRTSAVA